jgi:hypothetical protein
MSVSKYSVLGKAANLVGDVVPSGRPLLLNGWPDVRRGDVIEVLSGEHKGSRKVCGYDNHGRVWIQPERGVMSVEVTGNWRKIK